MIGYLIVGGYLNKRRLIKTKCGLKLKIKISIVLVLSLITCSCMQLINTNHFAVLNANLANLNDFYIHQSQMDGEKIGCIMTHGESNLYLQYSYILNQAKFFGATVEDITATITTESLSTYTIVVIGDGGSSWSASELTALDNWVRSGRSIYILGDNKDASQVSVSNKFNVFYGPPPSGWSGIDWDSPLMVDVTHTSWVYPSLSTIDLSSSTNELTVVISNSGNGEVVYLQKGKGRLLWNVFGEGMIGDSQVYSGHNRQFSENCWIWLANNQVSPFRIDILISIIALNPSLISPRGLSLTIVSLIIASVLVGILIIAILIISLKTPDIKPKPKPKGKRVLRKRKMWNCPYCHAPVTLHQVEKLKKGESVNCEYCRNIIR